jgi:predicted Fe-Mo cluster-binding NifX family protein
MKTMRIAFSSTGRDLESDVDPRFGRAAFFVIVDSATMDIETVENTQSLNLSQGAGIQAAQTIAENHVDCVITGHCGPKAFKVLQTAGVKIMTGAKGKVADAVRQYENGELEVAEQADVEGHWV